MIQKRRCPQGAGRSAHAGWATSMAALALLAAGCSVKRMAVNRFGDALAGGGDVFASDSDPELIRDASPFSLKLLEGVLAENPNHRELLLATARGFCQYARAFVQEDADTLEGHDLAAARQSYLRARGLYLRARDYGLRGLATRHPRFEANLRANPAQALKTLSADDVALAFWTAASWGAAISVSKDKPDLIADLPLVEAMLGRTLELDESFGAGAIHTVLIPLEVARGTVPGGPAPRARKHFDRSVELSNGQLASPFVTYAEQVCVRQQNRAEFEALLKRAIEVKTDARPESRVENVIMQRRARWLLSRADELFVE